MSSGRPTTDLVITPPAFKENPKPTCDAISDTLIPPVAYESEMGKLISPTEMVYNGILILACPVYRLTGVSPYLPKELASGNGGITCTT
ncbi:hypothetical protein D3C80_789620 [compost metagenome]